MSGIAQIAAPFVAGGGNPFLAMALSAAGQARAGRGDINPLKVALSGAPGFAYGKGGPSDFCILKYFITSSNFSIPLKLAFSGKAKSKVLTASSNVSPSGKPNAIAWSCSGDFGPSVPW